MSSSIIHQCQHCGYESEVSSSLSTFAENPHCRKCGLSASEGETKMQEDLAALFSRNMVVGTMSVEVDPSTIFSSGNESIPRPVPDSINYSITQHYHHSSHQAPHSSTLQRSPEYRQNQITPEETLTQSGIDPTSLNLAQLSLIQNADQDQLSRLIELWRISAQTPAGYDAAMEGVNEGMDNLGLHRGDRNSAEPYMLSGYEFLAKREYDRTLVDHPIDIPKQSFSPLGSAVGAKYQRHSDPSYDSKEWWRHGMANQPMEYQYGAFEHFNHYGTTPERDPSNMEDEEML